MANLNIDRINELYRKSKQAGLTDEEKERIATVNKLLQTWKI